MSAAGLPRELVESSRSQTYVPHRRGHAAANVLHGRITCAFMRVTRYRFGITDFRTQALSCYLVVGSDDYGALDCVLSRTFPGQE